MSYMQTLLEISLGNVRSVADEPMVMSDVAPAPVAHFADRFDLAVVGVGLAGCGVVKKASEQLANLSPLLVTTRAIPSSLPTLLLGENRFFGKGAGADRKAAAELAAKNETAIKEALDPRSKQLIFVVAGLGRGTGAGMAPVVAKVGRDAGATVVALAIMPFRIDGERINIQAENDLRALRANADATIVLSNEQAYQRFRDRTTVQLQAEINSEAVRAMRIVADAVGDNTRRGVTPAQFASTFASGARAVVASFVATSRADIANSLLALVDVDGARTGLEGTKRSIVVVSSCSGVTVSQILTVRTEVLAASNDMAHECTIIDRLDQSLAPGQVRISIISATDGANAKPRENDVRQGGFDFATSRYRPVSAKATAAEMRMDEVLNPMKVVVRRNAYSEDGYPVK